MPGHIPELRAQPQIAELSGLIKGAIERKASEIIESEIEDFRKRVEDRVRGSVGDIAARVLERFSMQFHEREIIIHVDISDLHKKAN